MPQYLSTDPAAGQTANKYLSTDPAAGQPAKVAEAQPKKQTGLAENAVGAIYEPLANMATGMLAKPISDIAGLAATGKEAIRPSSPGSATPQDFQRHVQESMTYQPRTSAGQAVTENNPIALLSKALGWGAEKAGGAIRGNAEPSSMRGMAGNAVQEGIMQAPALAGAKTAKGFIEKAPERQAALDTTKGENAVQDATRNRSQASGYITPPESGIKAGAAGLAGKSKVEKIISEKNSENATRRLGKEVDIPEGSALSQEEIGVQKKSAGADYDALAKAAGPKLMPTPAFKTAINDSLKKINEEISFNKVANAPLIPAQKLLKSFANQTEFPTASTIRAIQKQRSFAKDDFRKGDSEMGTARLAIANQLENMFEENIAKVGPTNAVEKFKQAREKFAKLYLLDRITNEATGKVDLAKLAALSESKAYKGVLTGAFKDAADFAKSYRKAAQKPTGEAAPRLTVFDGMFGLGSLVSGHPGLAAAEIGGRIGIPALAERGMMQNKTPSYQAGSGKGAQILPFAGAAMNQGPIPPPP